MSDAITDQNAVAAAEAEAAAKKAAEAEAVKTEAAIPTPPKGADFDTVAAIHSDLVAKNNPAAAAFHKKHVLGFKGK